MRKAQKKYKIKCKVVERKPAAPDPVKKLRKEKEPTPELPKTPPECPKVIINPSLSRRKKLSEKPSTEPTNICCDGRQLTKYVNPKAVKPKPITLPTKYKRIIKICAKKEMDLQKGKGKALKTPKKIVLPQKPSVEVGEGGKVSLKKATPTASMLVPPTDSELERNKPKTGIKLNQVSYKEEEPLERTLFQYSSFDLVERGHVRPIEKHYVKLEKTYLKDESVLKSGLLEKEDKHQIKKDLKSVRRQMEKIREDKFGTSIAQNTYEMNTTILMEDSDKTGDGSTKRKSKQDESTFGDTMFKSDYNPGISREEYKWYQNRRDGGLDETITSYKEPKQGEREQLDDSLIHYKKRNYEPPRKLVEERITRITDLTMQDTGLWDTKLIHDESTKPWSHHQISDKIEEEDEEVAEILEASEATKQKSQTEPDKSKSKVAEDGDQAEEDGMDEEERKIFQLGVAGEGGGEGDEARLKDEQIIESYLTKQFRKKVSQHSVATSYNARDTYVCPQIMMTDSEILAGEHLMEDKLTQKFMSRDDEKPTPRKFHRGTLESHSFTDLQQTYIKDFYFGSTAGSMHKSDPNLSVDGKQGICIPVTAYCFAFLKHPVHWQTEDVDEVMITGTNLYLSSLRTFRIQDRRELTYQELDRFCVFDRKKIRFIVDEPGLSGFIFSKDKRIYNLTKALKIFFARDTACIFISNDVHIAIWKDKYYYLFDGVHRTKDMYISESGVANVCNFYDIEGIVTILLQRSGYGDWPFVLHSIRVIKVLDKHTDDSKFVDELNFNEERDNYNIVSSEMAVLRGSYHLGDLCFKFMRNKQAIPACCMALIYSRLTPASAWTRITMDKILTLGSRIAYECLRCDQSDNVTLQLVPAFLAIGPYIVEIYIHENLFCDSVYKRCKCMLQFAMEEFFENSTNGLINIQNSMMAIFKQRSQYFLYDPYGRNKLGTVCRDGAAAISMHSTVTSLVNLILANHEITKEVVFHIHGLKVCKIIRDPSKSDQYPKNIRMNDITIDAFKGRMSLSDKKAVKKRRVALDFSRLATQSPFAFGEEESLFQIGQGVESFMQNEMPRIPDRMPVKPFAEEPCNVVVPEVDLNKAIDLDSPALSETQVPAKQPDEDHIEEQEEQELEFMDLCSFDLTMDELVLEPSFEHEAPEGFTYTSRKEMDDELLKQQMLEMQGLATKKRSILSQVSDSSAMSDYISKMKNLCKGPKYTFDGYSIIEEGEDYEFEGEGGEGGVGVPDDEFFYTQATLTQVNTTSLEVAYIGRMSEMMNTDITSFPTTMTKLYPTFIRHRIEGRRPQKPICVGPLKQDQPEYLSQQLELEKLTNFVDAPDGSQLLKGTKNIADFNKEVEFAAPFMCIMAAPVARKYTLGTWSKEIIDYILECGSELYQNSPVRYDQVTKMDIPRISLGSTDFRVSVQYIFDSYMKPKMVELAITKVLFSQFTMGILVTPTYACTILYKNFLFYLFDPFANNTVGLSEGSGGEGTACMSRFTNIADLVRRIMYNKRKRELGENVEYCRFVLSAVDVRSIPQVSKDDDKYKQKGEDGDGDEDVGDEEKAKEEQRMVEEAMMEEGEDEKPKEEPKQIILPGYQYKKGLLVIEGSSVLEGRSDITPEIKNDHFICLCACLAALMCPIPKWHTKKVDQVIENGNHIYRHADDVTISSRRFIKNILIGDKFFDVVIKRFVTDSSAMNANIKEGMRILFSWKMCCFLVQFSCACYAVYKSNDDVYHMFDPYGPVNFKHKKEKYMAGWVRCKNLDKLQKRMGRMIRVQKVGNFQFYTFEITSIKKASKDLTLSHRLHCVCVDDRRKKKDELEKFGKPFNEDPEWLLVDPIPWSRKTKYSAYGRVRGCEDNMWNNWDIEYPNDLYSMIAQVTQFDELIPSERRGKGTIFILVVCLGMLEIYELSEWSPAVLNSVMMNGDTYFFECIKDKDEDDYELSMEDLNENAQIFPYQFNVTLKPVSEGSFFVVRDTRFNLYKGLKHFFADLTKRYGIIYSSGLDGCSRKYVAFGRTKPREYFVFDCDTRDAPMFNKNLGKPFILRMTTLNRLVHVLTLTLRGGNFYIFDVTIKDLQPVE